MGCQGLAHQALGRSEGTGGAPVGIGQGQQFGALEQARLQLANGLEAGIGQQAVDAAAPSYSIS